MLIQEGYVPIVERQARTRLSGCPVSLAKTVIGTPEITGSASRRRNFHCSAMNRSGDNRLPRQWRASVTASPQRVGAATLRALGVLHGSIHGFRIEPRETTDPLGIISTSIWCARDHPTNGNGARETCETREKKSRYAARSIHLGGGCHQFQKSD